MSKFIDSEAKAARFLAFLQLRPRLQPKLEDVYWKAILSVDAYSQSLPLDVKPEDREAVKESLIDRLNRIWDELSPLLKVAFKVFLALAPLFDIQLETRILKETKSKAFKSMKNFHAVNLSISKQYYDQLDRLLDEWTSEDSAREAKERKAADALLAKQKREEARKLKVEAAEAKTRKVQPDVPPQLPVNEPVPAEKEA